MDQHYLSRIKTFDETVEAIENTVKHKTYNFRKQSERLFDSC